MGITITYGSDGYCAKCAPEHPHPLNNLISEEWVDEPELPTVNTDELAHALSTLPEETLSALKQALGIA